MSKRAVDLSLEELAAMGANAALTAALGAYDAGLSVAGTVDVLQNGRVVSSLVERRSSGAVTALGAGADPAPETGIITDKPRARNSAD